jgi:tetratricopeptide (TPR) repeat protein
MGKLTSNSGRIIRAEGGFVVARERPSDYLPAHVVARQDFAQACGARDMGEILRIAKQYGGVGFTASHLARRCELTTSRVQEYIKGQIEARRIELFERVADGLHIPGGMLNLGSRPWESQEPVPDATDSKSPIDIGETSVLRRDFMKLGAGLAAATVARRIPGIPSRTAGNRIGGSTIDELRATMERLRKLDDHLGGADTYDMYCAEYAKTGALLKGASLSTATRDSLLSLHAEQAQQAGWAAFDAGWHREAEDLYRKSFDAAKGADNLSLAGNSLILRGYQLLSLGKVDTTLADKACGIAEKSANPAVRSLLFQRSAWTYALAGQSEQVARVLGQAGDALAGDASPDADWALWAHNPVELEIMTGRCWTELHRPLRAVPALEAALSQYGDSHARDKSLYLTWLADAYLDAGEVEPATAALGRSLDLAGDVASARPLPRVDSVLGRLAPHHDMAGVAQLLDRRRLLDPVEVSA